MAVDTQKFLALPPAKKGGDLASVIKPKESSKKTVGGKLLVIKTKIVKASDILKGTLAAEKKNINDQRKIDEKNKRAKKEEEVEQPKQDDKDAKKLKIKLPAFSWLDSIKNFIFTVLFGWAAVRLLKFLPELVKLLKPLAAIASFIMKTGELILKSLITLVDWGYKAYEWTRGAVGTVFGQDGVKKFDELSGVLNQVLNLTMALSLAMIAFSNEFHAGDDSQRRNRNRSRSRNLEIEEGRRRRFSDPEYKNRVNERYRRTYGKDIPADQVPKPRTVDQPRQPNLFDNIKKRFTPDATGAKPRGTGFFDSIGNRLRGAQEFVGDQSRRISEGFQGGMRRVTDFGDSLYRNTIGRIDEQLKKFDPGEILKRLSKEDSVIGRAARGLGGLLDNPLSRKVLKYAPFIGDAIVFLTDLLSGKHWVRALLRTVGAIGVDAGFYGLLALTGIAAPFSAGSSLLLSAALVGAYMAADAAAGAALGNDGIGQFLGDALADKLGVPKMAGEKGSGQWEKLFGDGGSINTSQGSIEKLVEGVKLSEEQKEAISRVGGGLGDASLLSGKTDTTDVGEEELKLRSTDTGNARRDNRNARFNAMMLKDKYGGTGYPITIGDRTYQPQDPGYRDAVTNHMAGGLPTGTGTTPINISSVQKDNSEIITGVSRNTSYESGSDSEVIVEDSGDESSVGTGDNQPVGATIGSTSGGDSSLSESAALQYKNAG